MAKKINSKNYKRGLARRSTTEGYSLIETLGYVAFMTIIVTVTVYALNALLIANRSIKTVRQIENSAIPAIDRMVREIREASDIDAAQSSLGVANGALKLTIPTSSGTRTARFYLSNQKIMVDDNGTPTGPLSLSTARVSSMKFFYLATSTSKAIKIELTILGPTSTPDVSDKFYATAVMRGAY